MMYSVETLSGLVLISGKKRLCESYIKQALKKGAKPEIFAFRTSRFISSSDRALRKIYTSRECDLL